jgi:hypothetical protein
MEEEFVNQFTQKSVGSVRDAAQISASGEGSPCGLHHAPNSALKKPPFCR